MIQYSLEDPSNADSDLNIDEHTGAPLLDLNNAGSEAGLVGNFFTLFLFPLYTVSFGASGAIFGLIGAYFITILYERDITLLYIAFFYLLFFIISSFAPNINLWAHLFGLLMGLLIGYIVVKYSDISKKREVTSF